MNSAPSESPVLAAHYGSEVFKQGLALYKRHSLPVFLLAFSELSFGFIAPLILPAVLKVLVYFVTPVISIGVLRCLRFLDQHPGQATVSETFKYFYDDTRRKDYLPFCIISAVAAGIVQFGGSPFSLGGIIMLLIEAAVAIAFFYGIPLAEFNRMPAKDAMKLSLDATTRNWKSLTVYGLLFLLYSLLSVVSIGIGFLFLIPISTAARFYFWQTSFDAEGAAVSAKLNDGAGAAAAAPTTPPEAQ